MTEKMKYAMAQLRHLYSQMVRGEVRNTTQAAEGLLSPSIRDLEYHFQHEQSEVIGAAMGDEAYIKELEEQIASGQKSYREAFEHQIEQLKSSIGSLTAEVLELRAERAELRWAILNSCQRGCSHEGCGRQNIGDWERYWKIREKLEAEK